jgi:hypothetical protein
LPSGSEYQVSTWFREKLGAGTFGTESCSARPASPMATITRSSRRGEVLHPHLHANAHLLAASTRKAQNILQSTTSSRTKRHLDHSGREFDVMKPKRTKITVEIRSKTPILPPIPVPRPAPRPVETARPVVAEPPKLKPQTVPPVETPVPEKPLWPDETPREGHQWHQARAGQTTA